VEAIARWRIARRQLLALQLANATGKSASSNVMLVRSILILNLRYEMLDMMSGFEKIRGWGSSLLSTWERKGYL
jgi:hypothetical protein